MYKLTPAIPAICAGYSILIPPAAFTSTRNTRVVGFVNLTWPWTMAGRIPEGNNPLLLNPQVLDVKFVSVIFTSFSNATLPFIRVSTPAV